MSAKERPLLEDRTKIPEPVNIEHDPIEELRKQSAGGEDAPWIED